MFPGRLRRCSLRLFLPTFRFVAEQSPIALAGLQRKARLLQYSSAAFHVSSRRPNMSQDSANGKSDHARHSSQEQDVVVSLPKKLIVCCDGECRHVHAAERLEH